MSRRRWPLRAPCRHPGCGERSNFEFDSKRDLDGYIKHHPQWACVRHTDAEEVLSAGNRQRTAVLVATDVGIQGWLFWVPEGQTRGGSGFSFGPGYKAFAQDFPAGTRLIITARVELPETAGGEAPQC